MNFLMFSRYRKFAPCFVTFVLIFFCSFSALAEEEEAAEGEEGEVPAKAIYLSIKPAFVVNYGGRGRLRYIKAEVSVRAANSDVAFAVQHHMPYIRNNLVRLFGSQTTESLSSHEGKELLRQQALEEVQKIILEEDGLEGVVDLYFNSIIIQK